MPEQDFNRKTASAAKFKRKREAAEAARTKPCTSSSGGTQRLPVAVAPCARDDPVRRHSGARHGWACTVRAAGLD